MNLLKYLKEDIWLVAENKPINKINFYKEVFLELAHKNKPFNLKWAISICKRLENSYDEIMAYIYDAITFHDMIEISKEVNFLYNKKIQPIINEFNGRKRKINVSRNS